MKPGALLAGAAALVTVVSGVIGISQTVKHNDSSGSSGRPSTESTSGSGSGASGGSDGGGTATGPQFLDGLTVTGGQEPTEGSATVNGHTLPHSLRYDLASDDDTAESSYDLGRRYGRFSATVGLAKGSSLRVRFEAFADGVKVFEKTMGPDDAGVPANFSLAKRKELRLVVTAAGSAGLLDITSKKAGAVWGDATLMPT